MAQDLSPAKCVLLAIHYASEGNIRSLQSFTPTPSDNLKPELLLRILLTYLPESIEPREYVEYVRDIVSKSRDDVEVEDIRVDPAPVRDMDEKQARKRVKRLKLLHLRPANFPLDAPEDILTQFLYHRAYRIDAETGLLNLVSPLVEPFLEHNDFLRTWYIGVVLPLLRMQFEYYPENENQPTNLLEFEKLDGKESVEFLMYNASRTEHNDRSEVARDIKGLVGPWMYGYTGRKRRRLNGENAKADDARENGVADVSEEGETGHDWKYLYQWMVFQSQEKFPLITKAVENWDGPGDIDLGGFSTGQSDDYLDEDTQSKLEVQYARAALASCYTVETDSQETIRCAHCILTRLATLLDFSPPPDLATSVDSLPSVEKYATHFQDLLNGIDLEPEALLISGNPLTTPSFETYTLLQLIVYSAYQLSILKFPISIVNVVKLGFRNTAEAQLQILQKLLRGLSNGGTRRDESLWMEDRERLMWLWNWTVEIADTELESGGGVFGRISRQEFEEELLKCLVETSCFDLAIKLYLKSSSDLLPRERIEQIVLLKAMEAYDSASNGNRTRGGMKKANDIVWLFRPHFPQSVGLQQAASLISATHALSFYSLTLQHGVPFQPVSIRVSQDPVSLISKVLEQNSGSYTQLDDLIGIAQNLASAGLPPQDVSTSMSEDADELEDKKKNAERRVTFMAIEASLREDDFETAYSYIVSRLTPSGADIEAPKNTRRKAQQHIRNISNSSARSKSEGSQDDISWRAAFLAGRFRPADASPPSLRRLEQRTELLSLALLLAPVSALSEILAAWRRCEEETTALQLSQQQAEEEIDDRADNRQSMDSIPGNFTVQGEQPALLYNQKRREMGRMTGKAGGEEAPLSMFDLTRSAAQVFSKNAFPLRGASKLSPKQDMSGMESSVDSLGSDGGMEGQQKTRKRDVVASAVSGGLASGLGWVLGATPVSRQ